jgi:hypothetical protein
MVSKKSKLIFLMPPKTASNSLSESLYDSSIDFDELVGFPYPKIHLYLSEIVAAYRIEDIVNYKIIQVTRNPMDRFVSSYFHQMRMIENKPVKISGMDIETYTRHFFKSLIHSEDDFLERFYGNTKFIKNAVLSGNSWGGSRLFLNQHQWNDMDVKVEYFKLEDLKEYTTSLSDYIGVYIPELPEKNTNKKKVDYQSLVTPRIKQIVEFVYEYDYELLNYEG